MKLYSELVKHFRGAGVAYGLAMSVYMICMTNLTVGLACGIFSGALLAFGVPMCLMVASRKSRDLRKDGTQTPLSPLNFRFRIRTIMIVIAMIAMLLACWQWTNTVGVQHLKQKYDTNARECVRAGLEGIDLGQTVDEYLESAQNINYFVNPRAIFPFVITVETDGSFSTHFAVHGVPGKRRTHIWFFGYLSEPL